MRLLPERLAERPLSGLDEAIDRARVRRILGPTANDAEALAMKAVAAEVARPKAAREAWRHYLEAAPTSPWAAHARDREAALARGGPRK